MSQRMRVCDDRLSSETDNLFTCSKQQLSNLLDLDTAQLMELVHARARRRFQRGLKRKPMALIKKLRQAKKDAPKGEKPAVVKTHLRDMIIVPEMIGSVIAIYNGKSFSESCRSFKGLHGRDDLTSCSRRRRWNQARNDWILPCWILHHLQTRWTWTTRRWSFLFKPIHPS